MIKIIVPEIPPSNNQFLGRNNRFRYDALKKRWDLLVRSGMKEFPKIPYEAATVHIHYIFGDKRRRDPDNYSGKMLLDPLVKYGVIEDDCFGCIDLRISAEYIKGRSETQVTVCEVEREFRS